MKIDKATLLDIPQLCILLDSLFSQEIEFKPNTQAQVDGLTTIIKNNEVGDVFVARQEGKIIGMINLLYTISTALGGKVAFLEDMVISSDSRGLGIGSKLISYTTQYAKDNECSRITLLTDYDNIQAHDFYRKHDFDLSSMVVFRKMI